MSIYMNQLYSLLISQMQYYKKEQPENFSSTENLKYFKEFQFTFKKK